MHYTVAVHKHPNKKSKQCTNYGTQMKQCSYIAFIDNPILSCIFSLAGTITGSNISVIHTSSLLSHFRQNRRGGVSCLLLISFLRRTLQLGSSESSKLGIQTLRMQPAQRQIGPPVLYVKLPVRKHSP